MECPYCHGELERGVLWSGRDPLTWLPAGKREPLVPTRKRLEQAGGLRFYRSPQPNRVEA